MQDHPRAESPSGLVEPGDLPDKRYFSIGEVAELCAVKAHVLRYWETEFDQLRPAKRRGNRRYYTAEDIALVKRIRHLLYQEGFTISGARQQLQQEQHEAPTPASADQSAVGVRRRRQIELLRELEELLDWLDSRP